MEDYAMYILTEKLLSTGMNITDINHLLARFLQEEAFDYVDYIRSHLEDLKDQPFMKYLKNYPIS